MESNLHGVINMDIIEKLKLVALCRGVSLSDADAEKILVGELVPDWITKEELETIGIGLSKPVASPDYTIVFGGDKYIAYDSSGNKVDDDVDFYALKERVDK